MIFYLINISDKCICQYVTCMYVLNMCVNLLVQFEDICTLCLSIFLVESTVHILLYRMNYKQQDTSNKTNILYEEIYNKRFRLWNKTDHNKNS